MNTLRPRVAIAGIHIESSTFSPQLARAEDFEVRRGAELLERYSWIGETWSQRIDWIPILHARALPGGVIVREAYDSWKAEILAGLRAAIEAGGALDGFFFDIHGAMSVQGLDDAEGDLITAIREVIGTDALVSMSSDLHGNVSRTLFDACDLLTTYRMAPHEDAWESRRRAMKKLAMRLLAGLGKPAKALVHLPFLLPGERTSTRLEPAKSLYAQIPSIEALPGVVDAAFWIGFAWADQPRCCAAVVVTGDDDVVAQQAALGANRAYGSVSDIALAFARDIWARHEEFDFVAPVDSMDGCLEWARTANRPTFISDTGDNPGAGGGNDVTFALQKLLAFEPVASGQMSAIYASIHDRQTVAQLVEVGVGGRAKVRLGGKIDTREPGPLPLEVEVVTIADDPHAGKTVVMRPISSAGAAASAPDSAGETPAGAVAGVPSGALVIATENRMQYGAEASFKLLGLDPREADLVVVKIGYLEPDLYAMAADWKMALTPGGVDQDLVRLGHSKIQRPMYPFDESFDFEPEVVAWP